MLYLGRPEGPPHDARYHIGNVPGVYISYPFCAQKCTYCNFASGVFPRDREALYLDALHAEIRAHHWQWQPETVYLGGGTPSNLAPESLAALLSELPGRPWAEATLEAAPGNITADLARSWAAAGIDNINIDLIAGLSGQTEFSFRESLDWIDRLAPEHVSVYMLEVDEDSRLGKDMLLGGTRYGAMDTPSDDAIAGFYEIAVDRLAAMGITRYEISNFARPGRESRHNLKYWLLEPYIGFGADAHSFDDAIRSQNGESLEDYLAGRGRATSPRDLGEHLFVGLRLTNGVRPDPAEWRRFDQPIRRFLDAGLLETDGVLLRLTGRGVLLSNEIFQEFLVP